MAADVNARDLEVGCHGPRAGPAAGSAEQPTSEGRTSTAAVGQTTRPHSWPRTVGADPWRRRWEGLFEAGLSGENAGRVCPRPGCSSCPRGDAVCVPMAGAPAHSILRS